MTTYKALRKFEVYHVSFNKKSDDYRQHVVEARDEEHAEEIVKKRYPNSTMMSGWPKEVEG